MNQMVYDALRPYGDNLQQSNNLQKDLLPDELFLRTHKRKSGAWVDTRSEDTYAKYKKKLATEQAQIGETSGDGVQKKLTNVESDVFRVRLNLGFADATFRVGRPFSDATD
ncbi:hypothetical protein P8452_38667 [Trifolium repens]|nr:hypothetical protein P8452_38667 [Trifolium repens]